MTAEKLMMLSGAIAFLFTLYWVRKREMLEKLAIIWIVASSFFLLLGLFPDILKIFALSARLSFSTAALFIFTGLMYIFAFFASLAYSNLYRRNQRLTQKIALLELRQNELEAKLSKKNGEGDVEPGQAPLASL